MSSKAKSLTLRQKVAAYESFLDKLASWDKPLWFLGEPSIASEARSLLNQIRGAREEEATPTERDPIPKIQEDTIGPIAKTSQHGE